MIKTRLLDLVGNTPVVELPIEKRESGLGLEVSAKLEYYNPTGSVKDRPANYILRNMVNNNKINRNTTIIESSSGNFGIAVAANCRALGIKFICVIDPLILEQNEFLLKSYGAETVKVTERDDTGGYLKNRLKKVNEILRGSRNVIWLNQYENNLAAMSHYYGTGMEIYKTYSETVLDYIFIPVSSGGTITGISQILKSQFPNIKIIAVDSVGSVIFGGNPKKRYIPGMGSSIVPPILKNALIDHVEYVEEMNSVNGCRELLEKYGLYVGGSSGAVYSAFKQYILGNKMTSAPSTLRDAASFGGGNRALKIMLLFPDRGDRYITTVFNQQWVSEHFAAAGDEVERKPLYAPKEVEFGLIQP